MFEAFSNAFVKELQEIKNSYYKLFVLTLFPFVCFTLVIAIFYKGVAYDMPVVYVDQDKSELSRTLLFHMQSSPTIKLLQECTTPQEASKFLQESKAYAVVIIPKHFKRDVLLKKQPQVTVMLNTQYILVGKILKAALLDVIGVSSAQVDFVHNLATTSTPIEAMERIAPLKLYNVPFFNTTKNYFYFLVTALLPSIWQIFIVIATLISFGSLFKEKREKEFFSTSYLELQILGKMFPYTLAFMFWGVVYMYFIYGTMGWSFYGSWSVMFFGMFVCVIAYQAMALLFFVTGFDYARSLSLGAVYTAPAFAFLGVTFPIYSMNAFALFWRDLLPISKLMELQISQANYGAPVWLELDKIESMALFWIVFVPVFIRFRQRLHV